jgi:hypothetical protein
MTRSGKPSAQTAAGSPDPILRASATGRAAQLIAVAGIIACPVLAIREITLYPGQAGHAALPYAGPVMTVMFAAELAVYLLLVLRRPGLLGAGRHSGPLGLAAAFAACSAFVLFQPPGGQSDNPVMPPAVIGIAIGALLAAGGLAALPGLVLRSGIRQSLRAGLAEVMWGCLLGGPAAFISVLLTTSRSAIAAEAAQPVILSEARQQGATSVLAWIAHDDLGGALVVFTILSIGIALIFAIAHAISGDFAGPAEGDPTAPGRPGPWPGRP